MEAGKVIYIVAACFAFCSFVSNIFTNTSFILKAKKTTDGTDENGNKVKVDITCGLWKICAVGPKEACANIATLDLEFDSDSYNVDMKSFISQNMAAGILSIFALLFSTTLIILLLLQVTEVMDYTKRLDKITTLIIASIAFFLSAICPVIILVCYLGTEMQLSKSEPPESGAESNTYVVLQVAYLEELGNKARGGLKSKDGFTGFKGELNFTFAASWVAVSASLIALILIGIVVCCCSDQSSIRKERTRRARPRHTVNRWKQRTTIEPP